MATSETQAALMEPKQRRKKSCWPTCWLPFTCLAILLGLILLALLIWMLFFWRKEEDTLILTPFEKSIGLLTQNSVILLVGGADYTGQTLDNMQLYHVQNPAESGVLAPKLITARKNHVAGVLDRKIIVAGGQDAEGNVLNSTEIFDPHSMKWTHGPLLQNGRTQAAAAVLDKTLYVCGGNDGTTALSSCEYLTPSARSWRLSEAPQLSRPLSPSAGASKGSNLYVAGHNSLQKYSKFAGFSAVTESLNLGTKSLSIAIRSKTNWLIVCGDTMETLLRQVCKKYDLIRDLWLPHPEMNAPRVNFSMLEVGNKIFALGGEEITRDRSSGIVLASVESREDKDAWKSETEMVEPRSQFAAVVY